MSVVNLMTAKPQSEHPTRSDYGNSRLYSSLPGHQTELTTCQPSLQQSNVRDQDQPDKSDFRDTEGSVQLLYLLPLCCQRLRPPQMWSSITDLSCCSSQTQWISYEKAPRKKLRVKYTGLSLSLLSARLGSTDFSPLSTRPGETPQQKLFNCYTVHAKWLAFLFTSCFVSRICLSFSEITRLLREEWFQCSWGFLRLPNRSD